MCKDKRTVEKILYSAMPTLDNYTNVYITKITPCFQELAFTQNQVIFEGENEPKYAHLIIEGTVKLVSYKNPYANPEKNPNEVIDK